ncbi:hypothetical protein ACI65C_002704 [Semiaphis heraclei]
MMRSSKHPTDIVPVRLDPSRSSTCSRAIDFSSVNYSDYNNDANNINKSDSDVTLNADDTDIFLSIYWKNGILGAASYNSQISEIQILHDVIESNLDFKMLNALFMQVRPANIVVCSLQDGHFLKIIKQLAHNGKINMYSSPTNSDDYKSDDKVHILPKQCFNFKTCEQLILSMSLANAPKNEKSRKMYLRSLIDFTQELAVCALGALLHFLDTPLIKLNLPTNFTIMSLRILNMDNLVWLGISTYESLQIFSVHEHPSAYKWTKNSTKEGSKKSKIENISELLDEITLKELQELPSYINECSICKMPEIGFLLCLPLWKPSNMMTENDYKIQNLEFKVALISYLCHIGCYVPAEYTEISILDHIHTRIQSTESVSSLMSAFMVDLKQISVALNESTCSSLVILDEFGKGTSEINGLALLLASISHFVHRPSHLLPHIIVSTHFHSLPNLLQQIINKNILNESIKYLSMSHTIENTKIVCLYKVVEKIENQNMSMAHSIAAQNGLSMCIVKRATEVLQSFQHDECVSPMTENLRNKLFSRRKNFIEKVLDLMQDKLTDGTFKDLVDDMENIRYP